MEGRFIAFLLQKAPGQGGGQLSSRVSALCAEGGLRFSQAAGDVKDPVPATVDSIDLEGSDSV